MMDFATARAGSATRRGAALTAGGILVLVAAVLPFATRHLPVVVPFFPMFAALACGMDVLTAYLLATKMRISGNAPLGVLAGAYLFSALVIVPHALAFPGLFSPSGLLGGNAQTSVWLWTFWHGGFPLWIIAYVAVERARTARGAGEEPAGVLPPIAWAVTAAAAATAASTLFVSRLPALVGGGSFAPGLRSGVLEAVVVCNAVALAVLAAGLRRKTVTQVWLLVAVVAGCADVFLTLDGGARFSAGWYLARCFSVASAFTVFGVFIAEINILYGRLASLATLDGLTGVGNRRLFDERLAAAINDRRRPGSPVSVILLDVDNFKAYNDAYGHLAGDDALTAVAAAVRGATARPADTVARYGGEEFGIVLPDTTLAGAAVVAERVRAAVEARRIPHSRSPAGTVVTASLGVAVTAGWPEGPDDVVGRADAALYRAKAGGRNRVCTAEHDLDPSGAGVAV